MNFIKGQMYDSKSRGKCVYQGIDNCFGQRTLEFRSLKHGVFRVLPDDIENNFSEEAKVIGVTVDQLRNKLSIRRVNGEIIAEHGLDITIDPKIQLLFDGEVISECASK